MWLDNLKELKNKTGMSSKRIAELTGLPERTIVRIFSGDTDDPYVSTIHRIVIALGGSLDHILAETDAVLSTDNIVIVKETAEVAEAERNLMAAENEMLKAKNAALATEIELLKKEILHKEELLALHSYYKTHIEKMSKYIEQLNQ